ncbi:histidine--tRNA ligase [Candidatus Alkanophaga liquidiphilum]
MRIDRPRGTRDFPPEEMRRRRAVERKMRELAERWGYEEVQTPTFEHVELFTLRSGEEIVKEMYDFEDKSGRRLALRPELTAPVIRMYVNEMKLRTKPLRLYYFGNCFRYERPQKGRFREFWQFGTELIGAGTPEAEAESIALAYTILKELNVEFELHVGHVGLIRSVLGDVPEEIKNRVMRLLDKGELKDAVQTLRRCGGAASCVDDLLGLVNLSGDATAVDEASEILRGKGEEAVSELKELLEALECYDVDFKLNFSIARGLDYYTGMVFEAYATKGLGAQRQICGGGSYRLAALFGGDDAPSTGFAIGFDRIIEICKAPEERCLKVVVAAAGKEPEVRRAAVSVAERLREDFVAYVDVMRRSLGAQLSFADAVGADFAVIVGKRELRENKVLIRDLRSGEQKLMNLEACVAYLRSL